MVSRTLECVVSLDGIRDFGFIGLDTILVGKPVGAIFSRPGSRSKASYRTRFN